MQKQRYHSDRPCQGRFSNPRLVVQEHRGAPLLNCSGIVIIRQLIERLGIARAINAGLRVLRRHKPYAESDHILTLIYNLLSSGETLNDINRLADDPALLRVLGTEQVPHATTVGDFLARFRHEKDEAKGQDAARLRQVIEMIQQAAFALLPRRRRTVATLDWDSSNHEVYGEQKEGADFASAYCGSGRQRISSPPWAHTGLPPAASVLWALPSRALCYGPLAHPQQSGFVSRSGAEEDCLTRLVYSSDLFLSACPWRERAISLSGGSGSSARWGTCYRWSWSARYS